MGTSIERRISELESRTGVRDTITVIVRKVIQPSANGPLEFAPALYLDMHSGLRVERSDGEGEEEFLERAAMLARMQNPQRIPRLLAKEGV